MTENRLNEFQVNTLHLFQGSRYSLKQKTALIGLSYRGTIDLRHFDRRLETLLEDALPLSTRRTWMAAPVTDAPRALGFRIRDLLVLLLGWSQEAIFEASLLKATAGKIFLAAAWERERTLRATLALTLRLLDAAGGDASDDALTQALAELRAEHPNKAPVLAARLAAAAFRKGHPVEPRGGFLQIGWGAKAKRLTNTMTQASSSIAVRTARQKFIANRILGEAGLPVPACAFANTFEDALGVSEKHGWPLVVKPGSLDGGVAVTTNINDSEMLRQAFDAAKAKGPGTVIVERHVEGHDYRLLVVGGRMLTASKRTPGGVEGDGRRTVTELVEAANADPRRGTDKQRSMLIRLALDEEARQCLLDQGLDAESRPLAGQFVRLRRAANISIGGTAEDVTSRVHPDNRRLAIRAARVIGLDIAGIDFLCTDIEQSWQVVGGAICEVNSQPMLRVHWLAEPARDFEGEIVDWLTDKQETRIPVVAVVGTDANTTALMVHCILSRAGRMAGTCTTHGVNLGDDLISDKKPMGIAGARMVLHDPLTDTAVIALPPSSLKQFGHPCDRYDVVAMMDTHGYDPPLIAETLQRAGSVAVIAADDPLCHDLSRRSGRPYLLVARDAECEALREHLAAGGKGAFVATHRNDLWIMLAQGAERIAVMALAEITATMRKPRAENEMSALFAAAIAGALGVGAELIRQGLAGFGPAPEDQPRRGDLVESQI